MLTGDLNAAAQAALLEHCEGQREEFERDVAKACHHASDDITSASLSLAPLTCGKLDERVCPDCSTSTKPTWQED